LATAVSRSDPVRTKPPIQRIPEALSPGVKLTTHLHLVPRLKTRGAVPHSPNMSSWCGAQWNTRTPLSSHERSMYRPRNVHLPSVSFTT